MKPAIDGKGLIVPKPDRGAIHDFAVHIDAVTMDQSIAGRLRRNRLLKHGKDADSTPEVLAQHVQASTSGKKPGSISSLGTGSQAVGAAEKTVGDRKSTVDADATRMAKLVAKQIESSMGDQPGPAGPLAHAAAIAPVGRSAS